MENLSLIAALGYNNELGVDNHLIWHIPEDLRFYRSMTIGKNIIMGRKTLESMPPKALLNRNVFVLSSQNIDNYVDISCFKDINSLLEYVDTTRKEFMVVGGASIYEQFLPYVDTMYLTQIMRGFSDADSYFPYFDSREWDIEAISPLIMKPVVYERNKYVRRKI